jgi:hypothetical protein
VWPALVTSADGSNSDPAVNPGAGIGVAPCPPIEAKVRQIGTGGEEEADYPGETVDD